MRTIRFRGKWVGNRVAGTTADKWEYGCLAFGDGYYYILSPSSPAVGWFSKKRVSPETIGQYTGLKDKNGVEIYEGDVVKNVVGGRFIVQYWVGRWTGFVLESADGEYLEGYLGECLPSPNHLEIIGNIHDNPELLEGYHA